MGDNLQVSKKLALKLLEQGFFNSLHKVENEIYWFKYSEKLQKLVEDYTIDMTKINEALEYCVDSKYVEPKTPVVTKTIKEPISTTYVKSYRVSKLLQDKGHKLLDTKVNPHNGKIGYIFESTVAFNKDFSRILNEPKFNQKYKNAKFCEGLRGIIYKGAYGVDAYCKQRLH